MIFAFSETPEMAMRREAIISAAHNFIDNADVETLRALSIIVAACMGEGGKTRATHLHGQITSLKRTKYDLCGCGDFHTSIEHPAPNPPQEAQNGV